MRVHEAYTKEKALFVYHKAEIEDLITAIALETNQDERYSKLKNLKKLAQIIDVF